MVNERYEFAKYLPTAVCSSSSLHCSNSSCRGAFLYRYAVYLYVIYFAHERNVWFQREGPRISFCSLHHQSSPMSNLSHHTAVQGYLLVFDSKGFLLLFERKKHFLRVITPFRKIDFLLFGRVITVVLPLGNCSSPFQIFSPFSQFSLEVLLPVIRNICYLPRDSKHVDPFSQGEACMHDIHNARIVNTYDNAACACGTMTQPASGGLIACCVCACDERWYVPHS